MTGDLEGAERALINALEPGEPPRSHELRTAWRDLGPSWIVNWAVSLGRDVRNAASALDRASELGATDEGAARVENGLWRVDSAYEKLHDVLSLSLGVPALKLNANRKGVKRFESDRKAIRKRLREVAEGYPAAGELLKLDESIANHRFLELRHQLTHSLAPILAWQSMTSSRSACLTTAAAWSASAPTT